MKRSVDRILTTHVGSLPRPPDLLEFLEARETGRPVEQAGSTAVLPPRSTKSCASRSRPGSIAYATVSFGKISYTFYVRHRLSGIGVFRGGDNDKPPQAAAHRDLLDHPDFHQRLSQKRGGTSWFSREAVPCCIGPVAYERSPAAHGGSGNLAEACAAAKPVEAFMNAASPGVLTKFVPDRYYRDEDAYVEALADALKEEYEAIHHAGLILQIDAPDLGSARHNQYQHLSDEEFLRIAERNIAALNHATANIRVLIFQMLSSLNLRFLVKFRFVFDFHALSFLAYRLQDRHARVIFHLQCQRAFLSCFLLLALQRPFFAFFLALACPYICDPALIAAATRAIVPGSITIKSPLAS